MHYYYIILRNVEKEKSLSFLPPWEFQTPLSLETPRLLINLPRKWLCINKDQTQRTNIKSSKGKTKNNTQGDSHKDNSWSFNRNSSDQKGEGLGLWQDILRVMKEKNLHPRLLYPARISFKYEGEIKSFTNKQNLREFSSTKPDLQRMLKDLL